MQTTIPCRHALFLAMKLQRTNLFSELYFGKVCLTSNWRECYTSASAHCTMPGDFSLELAYEEQKFIPLFAMTEIHLDTVLTKRRISSMTGSSTSSASVTASSLRNRRWVCKRCGKTLAVSTKHPPSACIKVETKTAMLQASNSSAQTALDTLLTLQ